MIGLGYAFSKAAEYCTGLFTKDADTKSSVRLAVATIFGPIDPVGSLVSMSGAVAGPSFSQPCSESRPRPGSIVATNLVSRLMIGGSCQG